MENNLIQNIKLAEKKAADLISNAEIKAEQKLIELRKKHQAEIEEVKKQFRSLQDQTREKAGKDAEGLYAKRQHENLKTIELLKEEVNSKKDEVVDYLIKKILE